jgi:hypothetical protein
LLKVTPSTERLERLKKQEEQLKARIQNEKAKLSASARKQRTGKLIAWGVVIEQKLAQGEISLEDWNQECQRLLNGRTLERALATENSNNWSFTFFTTWNFLTLGFLPLPEASFPKYGKDFYDKYHTIQLFFQLKTAWTNPHRACRAYSFWSCPKSRSDWINSLANYSQPQKWYCSAIWSTPRYSIASTADPYRRFETLYKLRCTSKKIFKQTVDQWPQLHEYYQELKGHINSSAKIWKRAFEPERQANSRIFKLAYSPPKVRQTLLNKVLEDGDYSKGKGIPRLLQEIQYFTPQQQKKLFKSAFSQERIQFRTEAFKGLCQGIKDLNSKQKQHILETTKELPPLPGNKSLISGLQRILKPE